MTSRGLVRLILFLAVSTCTSEAWAEEIIIDRFVGVGARAMGMGGAYIAVAEDFSAAYWNPAGLAQLRRIEAYGTLYPYSKQKTTSVFTSQQHQGSPLSVEARSTRLGSLGFVFPYPTYRGSLVFAGGYNRVKNFDAAFEVDAFSESYGMPLLDQADDEGSLGAYTLAAAVDVSASVSLGLALHVWDGSHRFTQNRSIQNADSTLTSRWEESHEYDGVSVDFGAMFRGPSGLRFGATIAAPVRYNVEENWESEYTYHYEDRDDPAPVLDHGFFDHSVTLPYRFGLGASWTALNAVVAGGISYTDWPQSKYDDPPVAGMTNREFQSTYREALRVHLGCEVLVPVIMVKARAGYYRDPIAFKGPRDEGSPLIRVENERDFFTLGAGALLDQVLAVNVAWVSGFAELTEGDLREERRTSTMFLSAGYRF